MTGTNPRPTSHPLPPKSGPDCKRRKLDQEKVAPAAPSATSASHHDGSPSTHSRSSSHPAPKQSVLDRWSGSTSTNSARAPVPVPPPKRQPPTYLADGQRTTGLRHALTRIACSDHLRVGPLHDGNYCVAVDEYTVAIVDGFPKAKYHLLVLPRVPFPVGGAGQKLTVTELDSLGSLLASPYAAQVLDRVQVMAERVRW